MFFRVFAPTFQMYHISASVDYKRVLRRIYCRAAVLTMAEYASSIPFITNIVGGKIVLRRRNIYIRINPSFKFFCNLYFIFDNKFIPHQISVFYRKIVRKSKSDGGFSPSYRKSPAALQKVKTYKLPKNRTGTAGI